MDLMNEFMEAVKPKESATRQHVYNAAVSRIEDGVVYVQLAGAETDTPTALTASEVKRGDAVMVEWRNNRLYIAGNTTDPAAGAARVAAVENDARRAQIAALSAVESAATASEAAAQAVSDAASAASAADAAQTSADAASNALKSVVQGATTVEKAVSVMQTALEAVVDYDPQNDTTTEYFWHDAAGAHVLGTSGDYRNDIDSTGMKIVETATEKSVAEFGMNGAQIGRSEQAHLLMTPSIIEGHGNDQTDYFRISESSSTDSVGVSAINSGKWQDFPVHYEDEPLTMQLSGLTAEATIYLQITDTDNSVWFGNITNLAYGTPASGCVFNEYFGDYPCQIYYEYGGAETVEFYTPGVFARPQGYYLRVNWIATKQAPTYVFGSGESAGAYAFSEGKKTSAMAAYSHAEGVETRATSPAAHAEGMSTEASGPYTHAQNLGTVAQLTAQTAIGQYNERDWDVQNPKLLIIGNGTDDNNRSNALTVDWSGNVEAAGDVTDGSGNVLSNKADATDVKEIMVASVSLSSVTLTANGGTGSATGSVARTGYTPLGIVGVQKGGSGNGQVAITAQYISGTTATVSLFNEANASRTVTVTAYVLYKAS